MATRTKSKKDSDIPPLTPDQILRLENKPAAARMPEDLATVLTHRRVEITSLDGWREDLSITRHAEEKRAKEVRLK